MRQFLFLAVITTALAFPAHAATPGKVKVVSGSQVIYEFPMELMLVQHLPWIETYDSEFAGSIRAGLQNCGFSNKKDKNGVQVVSLTCPDAIEVISSKCSADVKSRAINVQCMEKVAWSHRLYDVDADPNTNIFMWDFNRNYYSAGRFNRDAIIEMAGVFPSNFPAKEWAETLEVDLILDGHGKVFQARASEPEKICMSAVAKGDLVFTCT